MSGLQWIRLDTTFFDNGKIANLVDERLHRIVVTHLSGMCHAGKTGTDGYIPANALRRFAAVPRDAEKLVESGLWIPQPGGWSINDWDEYQISDEAAKARSERARAAAEKRWRGRGAGGASA
jgi:hypothetical protein